MHIKQIVIENFRSYKGRHVLDDLDPGHNAIVGRNGSGKSSLLESITFVLSNRYHPITKEQRKALVNDDLKTPARSASVELIVVDPENLLSLSTPEVRIRREIFPDSDNITINNVRFSHSELFNLLFSVFPRENPYYIVRQDEVAHLATATDTTRFDVISIAVGVHKFQEGLNQLLNEIKKKEILLKEKRIEIKSRRDKLESMNDQYNRWYEINKIRRFMEHKLCKLNIKLLQSELSRLDKLYEKELDKLRKAKTKYEFVNDDYLKIRKEVSSTQSDIDHLEEIKKKARTRFVELLDELNSLEVEEKEIIDKIQRIESGEIERFTQQKEKLNSKILEHEDEYKITEVKLREAREIIERTTRELERREYQSVAEYRRKTKILQLQSGDEEVSEIVPSSSQYDREIQSKEKHVAECENDVREAENQKTKLEKNLGTKRKHLNSVKCELRNHKQKKEELLKIRDDFLAQRKEKQREADELHEKIESLLKISGTMKQRLQSVIRFDILEGIESVKKIVEAWEQQGRNLDVAGVNGLLLDLFTCTEASVSFPMEIIGSEQLFYHVVRDRRIVSQITGKMKEDKLGGIVHFIPLEDIRVRQYQYPANGNEWIPIVSYLTPKDDNSKKAVDFVFGNTGIVRNFETGIDIAKQQNLQSITLDGQRILGEGKFRGGYRDKNFSRISFYKKFIETRDKLEKLENDYKFRLYEIKEIDQNLLSPINELQKVEIKIYDTEQHIAKLQIEIAEMSKALEGSTEAYNGLKMLLESLRVRLEETRREKSNITIEGQDLNQTLQEIEASMEELRRESVSLEQERKQAEMDVLRLENELISLKNILLKLMEDKEKLEDHERDFSEDFLNERHLDIEKKKEKCEENLKDLKEKLDHIINEVNRLTKKLQGLVQPLRRMDLKTEKAKLLYEVVKEDAEVIELKRDSLQQEIDKWREKDVNLGTTPQVKPSERFDDLDKETLEKKIRERIKQEKSIGVVAEVTDRMRILDDELTGLMDIQKKEEQSKKTYEKKMARINRKRVEALETGFRVINRFFGEIFGEIAADGRACLYPVDEDGEGLFGEVDWNRVREIRIRATFVGDEELDRMYQFSGGQKTIIALTLIFAVHKYRPIPFYLFDEIDKALDGNYRASVARFVHRLSRETQFLTITFKGELLMQADKYFKVTGRNNCSYVSDCSKEEAEGFVRREAGEE